MIPGRAEDRGLQIVCLILVSGLSLLTGCAARLDGADRVAAALGMERRVVSGTRLQHVVFTRGDLESADRIHVYLEGDGLPWRTRHAVASDPTPRDPLALRLMALDPMPSAYVGRPCYFGLAKAEGCDPWLWTHGRYSRDVVDSMTRAIAVVRGPGAMPRLTLIGYSGGGALAALIAPQLEGVERVVTLSANLDIDAWADHHGYSRLTGSMNPASASPLDARIVQLHLIGAEDQDVPPQTQRRFLERNPRARRLIMSGVDHRCCWIECWPDVLRRISPLDSSHQPDQGSSGARWPALNHGRSAAHFTPCVGSTLSGLWKDYEPSQCSASSVR